MYSVGITTFKRRYAMVEKLIQNIKKYQPKIEIILAVNADYKEPFDQEYRKKILQLSAEHDNVFPIIFPTFTGLAKMWNTIILNASFDFILMLNDDIEISEDIFASVANEIDTMQSKEVSDRISKINNTFSHFIISKELADEMNYFDERLLAFGEEDGDFTWRYIDRYKKDIPISNISGILNQSEGYFISQPMMEVENVRGMRLVPSFNRYFVQKIKFQKSIIGIKGMFDHRMNRVICDEMQYPYEKFKRANYDNIGKRINEYKMEL